MGLHILWLVLFGICVAAIPAIIWGAHPGQPLSRSFRGDAPQGEMRAKRDQQARVRKQAARPAGLTTSPAPLTRHSPGVTDEIPRSAPITLQHAQLDPASVFGSPHDVVECEALSRQQKIEILLRWEYEAAEAEVALEEGMPGRENDLQRQILLALERLHAGIDAEHVGPTKQHGLLPLER